MSTYEDVMTIEEGSDQAETEAFAMQRLINSGTCWKLQGSTGRMAMDLIREGQCMLGLTDHRDYYGNHVPSRDQVQEGTKGSQQYVENIHGPHYANRLAKV